MFKIRSSRLGVGRGGGKSPEYVRRRWSLVVGHSLLTLGRAAFGSSPVPNTTGFWPTANDERPMTGLIIPTMDLEQKLQELKRRDRLAEDGGGKERRERQHKEGKMSARERVEFLLDEGHVRGNRPLRHPSRDGFWDARAEVLRRRLHHRLWPHRGATGFCVRAGFHHLRRLAFRNQCCQDRKNYGHGRPRGCSVHWAE